MSELTVASSSADAAVPAASPAVPLRERSRRTALRSLARRAAELESANRELEAFTQSVSHDLRAPLRQIAGFTALLTQEAAPVLNDKARQYLADIADATTHMSALVDALLDLSRAGTAQLSAGAVDLSAIVRDVAAEETARLAGRAVEWVMAPLPAVRGDRTLLGQVFANLIGNAVKYTRTRPRARIQVGAMHSPEAGDVVIFVRDNGVGFDPRQADRLFRVFERLHPPAEFEGAGVGLATVRRIVERHGGRVWAAGAVDQGATFFVALPRIEAPMPSASPEEPR